MTADKTFRYPEFTELDQMPTMILLMYLLIPMNLEPESRK